MDLQTTVKCNDDALVFVSFYDQQKSYGFTISRHPDDTEIVIMVADQSCYRPDEIFVHLWPGCLHATLPAGTIDSVDGGEDTFKIEYDCSDDEYPKMVGVMKQLFTGKSGLRISNGAPGN